MEVDSELMGDDLSGARTRIVQAKTGAILPMKFRNTSSYEGT